jgi:hypothetical protein
MPFFDISLETANKFYEWGWRASITGAVITTVGVILLMYGTRVRDRDTEVQLIRANREVAAAQVAAQAANDDLAKIKEQNAPRHLENAQKQLLLQFLADKPKGQLRIKANVSVNDAQAYGGEIGAFLKDSCGWDVQVDNAIITGADTSGVWLTVKDRDHVPETALILHAAFEHAKIPIRSVSDVDSGVPTQAEVWLSVGAKK